MSPLLMLPASLIGSCILLGPTGEFVVGSAKATLTKSGQATLTCTAEVDPPGVRVESGFEETGYRCVVGNVYVEDWTETISAGGKAQMKCWARVR